MPYGFIDHLENEGYSFETVKSYEKVLNQFFGFLTNLYPNNKQPFEINPSDIKIYLNEQKNRDKKITTINKELTVMKTFFNFLWESNIVQIDPSVKIKPLKAEKKVNITLFYDEIVNLLPKILSNQDYSVKRKALFILALKGVKSAEFQFKKSDVFYQDKEDHVEIHLPNRVVTLINEEASIFLEYYHHSLFNSTDFVFTTKLQNNKGVAPIQVMSILHHLNVISRDYVLSEHLTLIIIRRALAYHMYTKEGLSIQLIAKKLGIKEPAASLYLKSIKEGTLK